MLLTPESFPVSSAYFCPLDGPWYYLEKIYEKRCIEESLGYCFREGLGSLQRQAGADQRLGRRRRSANWTLASNIGERLPKFHPIIQPINVYFKKIIVQNLKFFAFRSL